jgi:uncharacterized protein YkwD
LLWTGLWLALGWTTIRAQPAVELGPPPTAPEDVSTLPQHLGKSLAASGFSVNTTNREEVRSFYNAIYPASDNVPINSTANISSCVAGTNSADFKDAVMRRINWFRAMAGVPAVETADAGNNAADQAAALMMSANNQLSHAPTPSWSCFSLVGSNAASSSNIALGTNGAAAVTSYMNDQDTNNAAVGHRRWLLFPQTQIMGTGDMPPQGGFGAANAVWVFDRNLTNSRPATRTKFVAWPPAGYVPQQVVCPRWSFALTNADFTNATVTMTSNGVPISVFKEDVVGGFGEPTIVWVPMGLATTNSFPVWPFNGSDTVYVVAISNVAFPSGTSNFSYSVTVFDPAVPGAGYFPPVISGPAQPFVDSSNSYSFNSVSNVTSYQWRYARRPSFSLFDGAEAGLTNWTTNSSTFYSLITGNPVASGSFGFQMAHTNTSVSNPTPTPQTMMLTNFLSPVTNTTLRFKSLLGYGTSMEVARVQASTNGGASWFDIFSQPGTGTPETVFTTKTLALSAYAGVPLQIRFNYDIPTSGTISYYPYVGPTYGWHFDDIVITNCDQLLSPSTNIIAGTNFQFTPPQAGNYNLQARGVIFNDFPLDWGPIKPVTAVTIPGPVIQIGKLTISNNQARVDFALQSGTASTYKLLTAASLPGPWSTDNIAVLTTNSPGSYRFTTTPAGAKRFYKVQTP